MIAENKKRNSNEDYHHKNNNDNNKNSNDSNDNNNNNNNNNNNDINNYSSYTLIATVMEFAVYSGPRSVEAHSGNSARWRVDKVKSEAEVDEGLSCESEREREVERE